MTHSTKDKEGANVFSHMLHGRNENNNPMLGSGIVPLQVEKETPARAYDHNSPNLISLYPFKTRGFHMKKKKQIPQNPLNFMQKHLVKQT